MDQMRADVQWMENVLNQHKEDLQYVQGYVAALRLAATSTLPDSEQEPELEDLIDDNDEDDATLDGEEEDMPPSTPRPATTSSTRRDMAETELLQQMAAIDQLSIIDGEERERERRVDEERLRLEAADRAARAESERRRARLIVACRLDQVGLAAAATVRGPEQQESSLTRSVVVPSAATQAPLPTTTVVSNWLRGTVADDDRQQRVGRASWQQLGNDPTVQIPAPTEATRATRPCPGVTQPTPVIGGVPESATPLPTGSLLPNSDHFPEINEQVAIWLIRC